MYRGEVLPSVKWPDLLIVMGGPMSVHDTADYPWLVEEKKFIAGVIEGPAWVLGVCLGSQLIADCLGATVRKNAVPEIGWFPVTRDPDFTPHWLADILGAEFEALHWHGDTFELPNGAVTIGSSSACKNQGFIWGDRVIGLQFHLEFTMESTTRLADNSADDLIDSKWVQSRDELLCDPRRFDKINSLMASVLEGIEEKINSDISLHPQLAEDCHLVIDKEDLWVLLNKNASVPWFILVPKGKFRDLDDLDQPQREGLFRYADSLSAFLRAHFQAEKINVAALGNMVPQLHLHVIGRTSEDPCWPNPVWGNLQDTKAWTANELQDIGRLLEQFH